MFLRARDLWNACHVTCCYGAESSGMLAEISCGILATLHVATVLRVWNVCHVTCCYAAEISGMLATLHVATLPRSLECLPRYMLLRCRDLWNACHVTCCYAAESSGMRWGKGQFQDCFLRGGGGAPVSDFLWFVRLAKSVAIALSLDPYWHCGCCALILSGAHLWCLI